MNKVFRVIWSQATQSWVAVSELTKAHKKQSSSNAQKSAVKFSGNFIKSAAIALTLLSGHSAYAADAAGGLIQINSTGGLATANSGDSIAIGKDSQATGNNNSLAIGHSAQATGNDGALAIGRNSKAGGNNGIAVGREAETTSNDAMALGFKAKAENTNAVAIGNGSKASGNASVALGNNSNATKEYSYAIGSGSNASAPRSISIGYNSAARHNNSLALGYNTIASGPSSVALGAGSNALGDDSYAIGYGSKTNTGANFAMAFGNSSKANKANDIAFGKEAETRDQGQGHSIAIGYGAMSGTNNAGKNLNGGDAGGVAIGTGAYTGVNQTDGRSVNSSVAVGAGAGAGFRKLDASGMPDGNATDVDNNVEVLKKAFGVKNVEDYQPIAKGINGYTNVAINEGTALGRNARAIGDQSIAIGAQTIAGMGAVALGGNDITQFANNRYYKSTKENFGVGETIDHNQDAIISAKSISDTYKDLVGSKLDTAYKATYAQDGSVVLGMQAHSGTPLGTAIGTNALIRKGAFGATAIGAGSQVQANAEAAVAIGMGSFADGKYAVAAGTAARAKESAVAAGYSANAEESAVAVGDSSKAVVSSVAVGRGAKAEKVADIAVGKGAVASGEQGAIAMGLGTIAKGHSSIMIGGSDISKAASETVNYVEEDHNNITDVTVEETINGEKVKRHYKVVGTTSKSDTLAKAYEALTGKPMDTTSLDYSKVTNGHSSISLGIHALSQGNLGTAIGTGARADSLGSIALGAGAKADRQNAVAIGTGSTTELQGTRQTDVSYNAAGSIVSFDSPDVAYTFKWAGGINTSSGDVVSFGSAGAERQLKNVAAGRVAEDSTDAINGSQLNSVARKVASGWQVAGDEKTKVAGIGSDDQVNFTNGNGTTVSVTVQNEVKETVTENGKSVEKIKTPKGANVKFDVKPADTSLEVGANGVKVKTSDGIETTTDGIKVNTGKGLKIDTADGKKVAVDADDKTITVGTDGKVKAVTGSIETVTDDNKTGTEKAGQVRVADAEKGKLATVDAVASAVNNAAWSITSDTDGGSFATSGHTKTTEKISAGGSVTFKAGDNLIIKQAGTDFTYSLNPILSGLTSAEFKGTGKNAPTTKLTNAGITITSATTGKNPVSLTENGLNNGGNAITNVAGNLDGAKTGTKAPTTSATKPTLGTAANEVNSNNAATVGDVLNAGWNLQEKGVAKDFVTAYDTVNFVDGDGTSVSVENTDNKTSKIKYSVNLGDGLEKDATTNKIKVKAADKSLEVTNGGVKVKAADNTLTTDANGLKVNTGNITASSVPTVTDADKDKIATVGNVAEAIKAAAWKATSDKTDNGENSGKEDQEVKAGDTVTFEADKNIKIAQAKGKFTFSTKDDVEFNSVQLGGNKGPKLTKTDGNDLKVSGSNGTDPVKITNVADGNISADSKDAINGSQFNAVANNNIKLGGDNNSATDGQSLNKAGGMKFNINGANGIETAASGDSVTVKINAETKAKIDSVDDKADKNLSNITADGETKIKNLVTWKAKASNSGNDLTENDKTEDTNAQQVGADGVLTLDAGKNLLLKRSEKTFTYALSKTLSDLTSAEFKKGDVTTKINGDGLTIQAPTPAGGTAPKAITVNKDGISAGDKAITDVNSGLTNYGGTDAKKDLINLGNSSTGSKVSDNNAATVGDLRNMGWVVSSDKTTDNTKSPYSEAVKNADEVKFVGKGAAKVSGKTDPTTGIRTITVDVEVPDVKTAKLVSSTDGSVIAPSTNSKLQEELKTAKDKLAALPNTATEAEKEAAEKKVKDAETALNNTVDDKGVATAKNVADMINASGFTLKTSATADGKKDAASTGDEVINPGKAVEMVAGKNLTVKQEANGKVTYSTKDNVEFTSVKVGEDKDGKKPVNFTTDKATDASNNDAANKPTTALNISSGTGADAKPTQLKGVGSTLNTQDIATAPQGKGNTNKPNVSLVNLAGTDKAPVNKNAAATVGDLQNMGWVVSTKDGNGYTDVVKNANQVDFKGTGLATVTGETDKESGIRTITVNVDAQKAVEAAQTPVVYTNKAGDKLVKVGDKFYKAGDVVNGKPKENAQEVPKGDVIASMNNGDNNTNKPMQLANIGSNLPTVNDTSKQAFDPNSTTPKTDKNNKSAPMTAAEAAELLNPTSNKFAGNNAATVSDVLNAGWNLQGNGSAVDFVKPFDTVNFVNGKGTKAVVETADNLTSTVKFDVDAVEITAETKDGKATGKVVGPTTQELKDALEAAKKEAEANPADEAKKKALKDAQSKVDAANNQVATAQNVADMINNSGFTLKTSATAAADNLTADNTLKNDGEVINPGKTVEMVAGKNLTVKQEKNGKVTYSTKDDVSFNTVNVGDNTYVDKNGKPVTKDGDKYKDAEGNPVDAATVTKLSPVAMKAEKAKPATNNGNEAKDQPTTALNVSSSDGKPTQITGVGSTLNVKPVDTNPNGTATTGDARPNLVDLVGSKDAPVNKNSAATVGDLQNMGWVVSTKDGNGYTDVVKNANQVDFKGGAGISVKGETTKDGVREITISVKDGEVVKPNQFIAKVNGKDTPVTKVGDQYYNTADIDPKTGEPKTDPEANVTPVTPDAGTTPTNAGDGYVTGNKVAAAIQKSGFVVGKQKNALSAADFKDEDEKVNPDDELRFADGNNTKVKLATKKSVDKDGNKVTTTTVKVDVAGLPVQYTDKNGTPVTKVGDQYFTVDDKGNPTATEVKPEDLTTNMVNPAAAPNGIGAPTTLGNVKSNLPSVNDADKNAKDVAGNPIAGKDNKSAPIDAAKAADIAKNTGNNAATVSDVLNAGWNLQNNGEARDFVKPFDTVNFVNGKGTKAVVETADNLTSTVKFDVDAGEITRNTNGSVNGPTTAGNAKKLAENLAAAQKALNDLPADADDAAKKKAQDALKAAQDAAAPLNKVATAQNVAEAINNSGWRTNSTTATGGAKDTLINPGKAVNFESGKNMEVAQTVDKDGNVAYTYKTKDDVNFNSVQLGGNTGPKLTKTDGNDLKVSGSNGTDPVKITNVTDGNISADSKDAVNGSQLHATNQSINRLGDAVNNIGGNITRLIDKVDNMDRDYRAGIAGSNAAAGLPQAYLPGKSMVAAAAGTFKGQNALAVGYSSISDNGKLIWKAQANLNSRADVGASVGIGYLW
ncbi:YadA-like family protein [Neisseria lactamica]|uniref:YadA-like family protein n=1 Tax=Neisseria lactamica TaxID=486 RepID=UPI0009B63570|nr:YadA-like family protein [Neisseria lactamica]